MRVSAASVSFLGVLAGWLSLAILKISRPDIESFSHLWRMYGVEAAWPATAYWSAVGIELGVIALVLVPRLRRAGFWISFWLASALLWANIALAADRMDCGCFGGFDLPAWAKYAVLATLLAGSAHQLSRLPVVRGTKTSAVSLDSESKRPGSRRPHTLS